MRPSAVVGIVGTVVAVGYMMVMLVVVVIAEKGGDKTMRKMGGVGKW